MSARARYYSFKVSSQSLIIYRIGLEHCFNKAKIIRQWHFLQEIQNNIGTSILPPSLSLVPMVAPGNVHVTVVNSTLAEVHWDQVPLKSVRGHLQGYRVSEERPFLFYPSDQPITEGQMHFSWLEKLILRVHLVYRLRQATSKQPQLKLNQNSSASKSKGGNVFSIFSTDNLRFCQLSNYHLHKMWKTDVWKIRYNKMHPA